MKAPTAAELIEAVRERMDDAVDRPIGGFEARVVRNVLAIVERELALGSAVDQQRRSVLAAFDAPDESALAAAIRAGGHDDEVDELRKQLLDVTEAQLDIDNPRWSDRPRTAVK